MIDRTENNLLLFRSLKFEIKIDNGVAIVHGVTAHRLRPQELNDGVTAKLLTRLPRVTCPA